VNIQARLTLNVELIQAWIFFYVSLVCEYNHEYAQD
jgi:hypothetical protein